MTGYKKYTKQMEDFKKSETYKKYYEKFILCLNVYSDRPNPMTTDEIKNYLWIKDARKIRILVKAARFNGVPVASSEKGYFVAKSFSDLDTTLKHLTERRDSLDASVVDLNKCFPDSDPSLFDAAQLEGITQ